MADADRFRTEIQQPAHRTISSDVVDRFRESLVIDYERWREGIGYDIAVDQETALLSQYFAFIDRA